MRQMSIIKKCIQFTFHVCILSKNTSNLHIACTFINSMLCIKEKKRKEKMYIQIKNIWYYNVYIHKLNLSINYSDWNISDTINMPKRWVCSQGKFLIQKWVNKIENNFTQNKYNKLQKISAKNKLFFAKKRNAKVQIWDHLQIFEHVIQNNLIYRMGIQNTWAFMWWTMIDVITSGTLWTVFINIYERTHRGTSSYWVIVMQSHSFLLANHHSLTKNK